MDHPLGAVSARPRVGKVLVCLLVAGLVITAAVATFELTRVEDEEPPRPLAVPSEIVGPDPLAFDDARRSAYERAAAFGLSHVLFAKSPGGVVASARRTADFRPLVEEAVAGSGIDPDLLEAIVFLESAGRPDVIAGHDVEHAAGLVQILAETATNFLGMPVDLAASRQLTKRIDEARRRGDADAVDAQLAERRGVDARFDPSQALAGAVRYLTEARDRFGREDLAVVSYHMGIGNLEGVLRAYSGRSNGSIETVVDEEDLDYVRVYFDSSPGRNRGAWERLYSFGDDSQTYYWRVLAAREIMGLFRKRPAELERLSELHGRGPSAELVLHPPDATPRFAEPDDLEQALARGDLRKIPDDPERHHFRIGPGIGREGARSGEDSAAYPTLRPRAIRLLRYLAAQVYELSGETTPLTVTRVASDEASAGSLPKSTPDRATHASIHATGYSFDVRRRYGSGTQAEAFQWTLERLGALGLIAWSRDDALIHVTVSPKADVRPPTSASR
ncbi:MAG: hypothetical protein KatS3mg012_0601 [Gaiellaceae bacterium]|nr:MAG: hypothetical protein KatS3mg012_0601 [Gaiellaceae bacterium]